MLVLLGLAVSSVTMPYLLINHDLRSGKEPITLKVVLTTKIRDE